jgi:hypothetical protein
VAERTQAFIKLTHKLLERSSIAPLRPHHRSHSRVWIDFHKCSYLPIRTESGESFIGARLGQRSGMTPERAVV